MNEVAAKRLTVDAANTVASNGTVTIAGRSFGIGSCELMGTEKVEKVGVDDGVIQVNVRASEALIVYL